MLGQVTGVTARCGSATRFSGTSIAADMILANPTNSFALSPGIWHLVLEWNLVP